jgi:hypothetical protein
VQIKEAIAQREEFRSWEQMKITEWQTKNIVAMVANTIENDKARVKLVEYAQGLSLTSGAGNTSSTSTPKSKRPSSYRTRDGKEISAKELANYSYEEIDHTHKEQEAIARARARNKGKNLSGFGGFTR